MARRTSAYVDTGALIALLDRSDTYHPLFAGLFSDPPPLCTSPLVVAEGHGWFLRRFDAARGLQFLAFLEDLSPLKVLPVGPSDLREAARYLRMFPDQPLTLADACGLWILKRHRIRSCWSTDRHLSLTGVPLVIHG
ncbi:MAG: PIN domain-containing protein [Planctomycetes bacterium]|nr:PIN domain-containing protein [Planctomycetota bacterium]